MPYYPKIKLLQLHIPKTGGTSIENSIRQTLNVPLFNWKKSEQNYKSKSNTDWQTHNIYGYYQTPKGEITPLQHLTYRQMIQDEYLSNDMVKWAMAVVRDPFSRLVSCYHWQKHHFGQISFKQFVNWIKENKANLPGAKSINHQCYQHLLLQSEFIKDLDSSKLHIIKFESLAADFEKFFNSHVRSVYPKIKQLQLRKDNITKCRNKPWQSYYLNPDGTVDQDLLEMVYDLYQEDFESFGYDKKIKL